LSVNDPPGPRRKTILVVANETLGGRRLLETVRQRAAEGDVRFVLCVPQNRPKAGLVIYDHMVFDAAQTRVDLALSVLHAENIEAVGEVSDPDPYSATMDAVHEPRPTEIVISTYPETRSGWLRKDLIQRVRDASGLPVEHIIEIRFVAAHDVPRPVPAIAQHSRGRFRFFPIPQHELRPAHDQLSWFPGSRFALRFINHATFSLDQGLANRFRTIESGFEIPQMRDRRRFGHPITLADQNIS